MPCFQGNQPKGFLAVIPLLGPSWSQGPPMQCEASQPRSPPNLCLPGAGGPLVGLGGRLMARRDSGTLPRPRAGRREMTRSASMYSEAGCLPHSGIEVVIRNKVQCACVLIAVCVCTWCVCVCMCMYAMSMHVCNLL